MAKRIKDKRKRLFKTVVKTAEDMAIHFKLVRNFPDIKKRLNYLKTITEELLKLTDPILEAGRFPELE